jgi:DNA polymerase III alpha subunit
MGFYGVSQLVRDARDHKVEIRPVCINASRWDCTLEGIRPSLSRRDGEGDHAKHGGGAERVA